MNILESRPISPAQPHWPVSQRPLEDSRLYGLALLRPLLIVLLLMAALGIAVSLPLDASRLVWFLSDCFAIMGCVGLLVLLGRGHTRAATYGTIGMIFGCITAIHPFRPAAFGIEVAGYGLVVALAGALLSRRSLVLMTLASVGAIIWAGSLRYPGGLAHPNAQFDVLTYSMLCASVACVLFFLRRGSSIVLRQAELDAQLLAQQVAQRTAEMAANEHYFESLINASLDAIVFIDPSNKIQYESPALETLLGYKVGERVGRDMAEFGHPDDLPRVREAMLQQLASGKPGPGLGVRTRHALGHWVDVECTGKFVHDKDSNAVLGLVVSMRDATLRKQSEAAIQQRIAFETLTVDISTRLIALPVDQSEAGIQYALHRLGQFVGVHMAHLVKLDSATQLASITHYWPMPGAESATPSNPWDMAVQRLSQAHLTVPPADHEDLFVRALRTQGFVTVRDMAPFIHQSSIAAQLWDLDVRSCLSVAVSQEPDEMRTLVLAMFDTHAGAGPGAEPTTAQSTEQAWSDDHVRLAQLVGQLISSMLSRHHTFAQLDRQIAIQQLVADVSNRIASGMPEDIDDNVQYALQRLGEFTNVDIARLFFFSPDGKESRNTHEWVAPGIQSQQHRLQDLSWEDKWWVKQFQSQHIVCFDTADMSLHDPDKINPINSSDALPPDDLEVQTVLRNLGVQSVLGVALLRDGKVVGEVGLDTLRSKKHWPADEISLVQLVAEALNSALSRKYTNDELQHRLAFEHLISNISNQFNAVAPAEVDQAIQQAMRQIGEFSGMEVARLFLITEDGRTVNNTHEWAADEADLRQPVLQDLPMQDPGRQYLYERLLRDDLVYYDNVADMPLEFGYLRTAMTMLGVRSFVNVLLRRGDEVLGDLGLSSQHTTIPFVAENLQLLKVVGELISNVLARKQATDKLSQLASALETERTQLEHRVAERTKELSQLLEVAKTISLTLDLPAFISIVLQSLRSVIPVDTGGIWEITGENQLRELLRYNSEANPLPTNTVWTYDPDQDLHLREMITRQVTVVIPDVYETDPFSVAHRQRWLRVAGTVPPSVRASLYVPLVSQHQVTGFIALHSPTPGFFDEPKVLLVQAFASQIAISMENALLHEQKVHGAAMAERSRIARELHDSVSQALFGVVLGTRTAIQLAGHTPSSEAMAYVLKLAEAALAEMRALIYELRPESLETEGLISALRRQATALSARHNLDVNLQLDDDEPMLPLKTKEALYRIGVEAVQNTIKHALATQVILTLRTTPQDVVLQVQDNGRGFDLAAANPGHFGLVGMRERAVNMGAQFHLQSEPGQGTCIQIRIPLVPSVSGKLNGTHAVL